MVLVDTSVWVAHLRNETDALDALLNQGLVLVHPFVIGELACGNLRNRKLILSSLTQLPKPTVATHDEVLSLIDSHGLMGKGLGYVDVHLFASALLTHSALWTLDKSLKEICIHFDVAYNG